MSNIIHTPQNRVFVTEILIKNGEEYYRLSSGERLVFGIKQSPYCSDYILIKEIGSEDIASDGKGYVVRLSTSETNIPCGKYCYDTALKKPDGELERIIECTDFIVTNSVVRSD